MIDRIFNNYSIKKEPFFSIKDKKLNANTFLKELGNPYDFSLSDKDGTKSILFGVYGIPESILIDKKHKIITVESKRLINIKSDKRKSRDVIIYANI